MAEPEAAWASPIGFGDQWRGHPVIGVAAAFLTQGGKRAPAEGRVFEAEGEAVLGSAVPLRLGDSFAPQHGLIAVPEGGHTHAESPYAAVGRLPPTGTPWDRAILVPIESVWEIHGLGNGHPPGVERIGPPWEVSAGVPAIVVKPRSIAGAYQLRARYRTAASTAVFPGEILAALFRTIGDVRTLLSWMAAATSALVVIAVFLAFAAIIAGRARQHAVLRAIGAPPSFVLAALWMELAIILATGVAAGLALGWALAQAAATALSQAAAMPIIAHPAASDLIPAAAILAAGLLAAAALLGSRTPALKR